MDSIIALEKNFPSNWFTVEPIVLLFLNYRTIVKGIDGFARKSRLPKIIENIISLKAELHS